MRPPEFRREWWQPLRRVERALRRPHRDGAPRRARRCGCTTTSCTSCRRCCARCGPTCASASSCTSRSRRRSCSCSCRGAGRSSRACSAPTSSASSARSRRRTSSQIGRRLVDADAERTDDPVPGARRCRSARSRSRSTSPSSTRSRRSPRRAGRAPRSGERSARPRTILLGVDRLDYTKGIDVRLQAFRELLESGVTHAGETVLVQVAVPSRERVDDYRQLRERVERAVGRINGEYGRLGHPADPLPAPQPSARGAVRLVPGRRRDARDAVARRHEPGRKEYVAARHAAAACWCCRSSPARPGAAPGAARQPARRRRDARDDRACASRCRTPRRAGGCASCAPGAHARRPPLRAPFLEALAEGAVNAELGNERRRHARAGARAPRARAAPARRVRLRRHARADRRRARARRGRGASRSPRCARWPRCPTRASP